MGDTLYNSQDSDSDVDSLFDGSNSPIDKYFPNYSKDNSTSLTSHIPIHHNPLVTLFPARRTRPPIPGLFFPSVTIPPSLAATLLSHTSKYLSPNASPRINQTMLFGRRTPKGSGLPPFLDDLIPVLASLLEPHLPPEIHTLLFHGSDMAGHFQSRQAILNYYDPGEGITPHVDLLKRFGDGIVGLSLGSGTVMTFQYVGKEGGDKGHEKRRYDIYLPERSVIVLTGEARYEWTHGIEERKVDYVEELESGPDGVRKYSCIEREPRTSITIRWLLPGADVVGGA
ncbi:hypothetical protein M422DRAFT_23242 [Sphaerobolus stellatus SS14]|nr:hypothetical protein M422DRAFT_23242 [Sphaerobolus stellatus SS14]